MSKQPEALRIADELETMLAHGYSSASATKDAAAELRRLYEENQKLLEALKPALENICAAKLCEFNSMSSRHEMIRLMDAAITAIGEALAEQPAQQEWPKPKFVRNVDGVPCITLVEHEYLMRSRTSPQPSQRSVKPWVGLTDEDIQEVREHCGITHHAIKTIEAKLREKNA